MVRLQTFIVLLNIALLPCFAAQASADQYPARPDIIIILADDIGYGDVGYQGSDIKTPNIDSLAKEGIAFKNFYSLPVCTQSRVALMTGVFPHRVDLHNRVIKRGSKKAVPRDVEMLSERLQSLDYQTAIIGKWHLGHHSAEVRPLRRGFDYQFGNLGGFIEYFNHFYKGKPDLRRQEQLVAHKGYSTHLFSNEATRFVSRAKKDKPLFLYLPFTAAHATLEAPQKTIEKYQHIKDKKRRLFAAVVDEMDSAIGNVLAAHKRKRPDRDTLIFFASDNGANTRFGGNNGPFQSGKGELYEGGIHVPAILSYPKELPTNTTSSITARLVDIIPTIYSLLTVRAPEYLDGRSLVQQLKTKQPLDENPYLLAQSRTALALRRGNWKIIKDEPKQIAALYDLEHDPGETENLIEKHRSLYDELSSVAKQQIAGKHWKQEHPDAYREAVENREVVDTARQ